MYQTAYKKGRYVGIAQTGAGWNVSTFSVSGNRVKSYADQKTRTLAQAKKVFTAQKKKYL